VGAATLDQYYVPTRYPDGLPSGIPSHAFDKEHADLAVARARHTREFVAARLQDR